MKPEILEGALKLYHAKGQGIDYNFYVNLAVVQALRFAGYKKSEETGKYYKAVKSGKF